MIEGDFRRELFWRHRYCSYVRICFFETILEELAGGGVGGAELALLGEENALESEFRFGAAHCGIGAGDGTSYERNSQEASS